MVIYLIFAERPELYSSFSSMLSRRHLRIKALQALYAFFQSGSNDLVLGEKQLLSSATKLYELYIYQLSFLVRLVDFAANRIEEAKKKYFPTDEDLNPNTRFIDNRITAILAENKDYERWYRALKINWVDEGNMFIKVYNDLKASDYYKEFISRGESSFKKEQDLFVDLIQHQLAEYELLRQLFEDRSIYWSDEDYDTSLMMAAKTIRSLRPDQAPEDHLPTLYSNDNDKDEAEENRKFMLKLYHQTILHTEEYEKLIEEQVENWEKDRIAIMDMLIMKMALAELVAFPSIPVKVTINEYIEISKYYSSVKSKVFINGILDKLVAKMKEDGRIVKTGRGLIE